MRYVVLEGLPAVGKSEILALLSCFYPQRVRVLPELVKEVATREGLDLFSKRTQLTEAILAEIPRRRAEIEEALAQGKLCLEESHLGVHLAYSEALEDRSFIAAYPRIANLLASPDFYLRLDVPIERSLQRQRARGTPQFEVDRSMLEQMLSRLQSWHIERKNKVVAVNADRSPSSFLREVEEILGLTYANGEALLGEVFDFLLLLGRPASGKSEFIDFMEKCPLERRARRYHIAPFSVIDDFPILWEKFEEDDLWEVLGRKRLYSRPADGNYSVVDKDIWPFLIEKINHRVAELLADMTALSHRTLIIEFSRGGDHGYAEALKRLSDQILSRAAILYVLVSFEESRRRNIARYDEEEKSKTLTHSVPTEELERTYGQDDWFDLAPEPEGILDLGGICVPYVTMLNEPESTDGEVLDGRYHKACHRLYTLWRKSQA